MEDELQRQNQSPITIRSLNSVQVDWPADYDEKRNELIISLQVENEQLRRQKNEVVRHNKELKISFEFQSQEQKEYREVQQKQLQNAKKALEKETNKKIELENKIKILQENLNQTAERLLTSDKNVKRMDEEKQNGNKIIEKLEDLKQQLETAQKKNEQFIQKEKIISKANDELKQISDGTESHLKEEQKKRQDFERKLREIQEQLRTALERENETNERYENKEEERRKIREKLRSETVQKENAIIRAEVAEKNEKKMNENSQKKIKELSDLKWENQRLINEKENIIKEINYAQETSNVNEVKYNLEHEEKLKLMKELEDKEQQRKEALIIQINERKQKEGAIKRAEKAEKTVIEQSKKIHTIDLEIQIIKKDYEKEKLKSEFEQNKVKQEQEKVQKCFEEKGKSDGENQRLKRDNQRIQQELALMKRKFGEEMIEKERKYANEIIQISDKYKYIEKIKSLRKDNIKLQGKKVCTIKYREQLETKLTVSLEINNSNKSHYEISNLNNNQKKINKISGYSYAPISLTQTLEKGIFQIELEFSNGGSDSGIGIVRDSYSIPSGGEPFVGINCQHMATFGGGGYNGGAGSVSYKGSSVSGNKSYSDNQKVMMEYDSGKCTLTLFINNEQQPVYVSGIKEKLGMYSTGRTCIIKSLKKVSAPTAIHLSNEKAV